MEIPLESWALAADAGSEGLLFCDESFNIVFGNRSAHRLFARIGKKQLKGESLSSLDPEFLSTFRTSDGSPLFFDGEHLQEKIDEESLEATGFLFSIKKNEIRSFLYRLKIVRCKTNPIFYIVRFKEDPDKDFITDLPTRRALDLYCRSLCFSKKKKVGSLIFCDLDHFKKINDSYGHLKGDLVLREIARQLRTVFSPPAIPFRFGGDEFVIIAPESTENDLKAKMISLNERLEKKRFRYLRSSERIHLNYGISPLFAGEDPDIALDRADRDFYQRKDHNR